MGRKRTRMVAINREGDSWAGTHLWDRTPGRWQIRTSEGRECLGGTKAGQWSSKGSLCEWNMLLLRPGYTHSGALILQVQPRVSFLPPSLPSAQSSFLLFFSSSRASSDTSLDGPSYLRHPFPILLRNFLLPVSSQSYVPFMLDATN